MYFVFYTSKLHMFTIIYSVWLVLCPEAARENCKQISVEICITDILDTASGCNLRDWSES